MRLLVVSASLLLLLLLLGCASDPGAPRQESDAEAWERLYRSGQRWKESHTDASMLYHENALRRARRFAVDDPRLARSEWAVGEMRRRQGRVDEARPLLESALERLGADAKREPELRADLLGSLGLLLVMEGRVRDAEPLLAECARLRLEALGPEDPRTAEALVNLAEVQRRVGMHAAAEGNLLTAASIYAVDPPRHALRIATIQNNLGLLYQDLGRFEAAERQHRQAIVLARSVQEEGNANVAVFSRGLADLFLRTNRRPQAVELYRYSYDLLLAAFGPAHLETQLARARLLEIGEAVEEPR